MCLTPIKVKLYSYKDINGEVCRKCSFNGMINVSPDNILNVDTVYLPCGNCIECLQAKTNEWAFRMMSEASLYKDNCFLTLTYKDNPVELVPRDLQLFIKRLRRKLEPKKIRFFACGEYGSKGLRPHYHAIIFNYKPNDLEFFFKDKQGFNIYKSKFIESIWSHGFITCSDINVHVCKYAAKYLQKLDSEKRLTHLNVKPFIRMSNRPGLGYNYIINHDELLKSDKLYFNGKFVKLPRYYLDVLERQGNYKKIDKIKENRVKKAKINKVDIFEGIKQNKLRVNNLR